MSVTADRCWPCRHWFLALMILGGSQYGAYRFGQHEAERGYIEERHRLELAQAEREQQQQAALSALQTKLQAASKRVRQQTKNIEAKVDETSLSPDCTFSADGLRLWNAANAGGAAQ